jgi:hypothetical protein
MIIASLLLSNSRLSNCFYWFLYRIFKFKPEEIIYRQSIADEKEKILVTFLLSRVFKGKKVILFCKKPKKNSLI